jgi:plastocyanin
MVSRVAWGVLVPFCVVLAVLAVIVIVRDNTKSEPANAPASAFPTVAMKDIAYVQKTLTVAKGAQVQFANEDVAPHTVTADDNSSDSGVIQPGKSYTLTVDKAFTYHCTIHPSMKAAIRLEG